MGVLSCKLGVKWVWFDESIGQVLGKSLTQHYTMNIYLIKPDPDLWLELQSYESCNIRHLCHVASYITNVVHACSLHAVSFYS